MLFLLAGDEEPLAATDGRRGIEDAGRGGHRLRSQLRGRVSSQRRFVDSSPVRAAPFRPHARGEKRSGHTPGSARARTQSRPVHVDYLRTCRRIVTSSCLSLCIRPILVVRHTRRRRSETGTPASFKNSVHRCANFAADFCVSERFFSYSCKLGGEHEFSVICHIIIILLDTGILRFLFSDSNAHPSTLLSVGNGRRRQRKKRNRGFQWHRSWPHWTHRRVCILYSRRSL
jgi:hypothetical protein